MNVPLPSAPPPSPEEEELRALRAELRSLDEEAVILEMKLETLRHRLETFIHEKLFRLGRLYARIDELSLSIDQALLAADPDNPVLLRRVQEARARLRRSLEAARSAEEAGPAKVVVLTPDLRALYRDAARRMHPDHGCDAEERGFRHAFMARLNAAYSAGDIEALQDVMAAWEAKAPPPKALEVSESIRRVRHAIRRFRKTLARLAEELAVLRLSPEYGLMIEYHLAEADGKDLFAETKAGLDATIERLEARLRDLEPGEKP